MNKTLSLVCVLGCLGLSAGPSGAADKPAKPDLAGGLMATLLRGLDADGDGQLGVKEAAERVEKLAQELDADGNGVLSEEELRQGGQKIGAAMREQSDAARQRARQALTQRGDLVRHEAEDIERQLEKLGQELERRVDEAVQRLARGAERQLAELPTADDARRAVDKALADARQDVQKRVDALRSDLRAADCPLAQRLSKALIDGLDTDKDGQVQQAEIDEIVGNMFGITDSDADGALTTGEVEGAISASLDLLADQARQEISRNVDRLANLLRPR